MRTLPALLTILLLATPAHAALVSYSFDVHGGELTGDPGRDFWYGSATGDTLRLTMTYDSAIPGHATATPSLTDYSASLRTIIIAVGPHLVVTQPSPGFDWDLGNLSQDQGGDLWGGLIQGQSGVFAAGPLAGAPVFGGPLFMVLFDVDATIFADDSLPVPFPTAGWDTGTLTLAVAADVGADHPFIFGLQDGIIDVNSIESHVVGAAKVPAPLPVVLLGAGLLALAAVHAARRRPWSRS